MVGEVIASENEGRKKKMQTKAEHGQQQPHKRTLAICMVRISWQIACNSNVPCCKYGYAARRINCAAATGRNPGPSCAHPCTLVTRHVVCLWDADNVLGLIPASSAGALGDAVGQWLLACDRVDHRVYANPTTLSNMRAMQGLVHALERADDMTGESGQRTVQVVPVSSRRYVCAGNDVIMGFVGTAHTPNVSMYPRQAADLALVSNGVKHVQGADGQHEQHAQRALVVVSCDTDVHRLTRYASGMGCMTVLISIMNDRMRQRPSRMRRLAAAV